VIAFRHGADIRKRLGVAPRLAGLLALIAVVAGAFSSLHQQPGSEERQPPLVVKAQPTPKEPVSAEPQLSPSPFTYQPPKAPQAAEPSPSTIITLRPPYDVVDVRTIRAGGRTITLAGIEGFDQNTICRARDGTRWSCAKLAQDALRGRVGSQSLRCSPEAQASAVAFMAMCTTSRGEDLARTLVAEGWARAMDDARQRYGTAAKAAEEQGRGLWGWQRQGRNKRR
jgi:endonuclease YncB( thermonuclease family)